MNEMQALQIVRILADGVDPHSGEVFSQESPYQKPETVRALCTAAQALERAVQWEERRKRLPANAGKAWNDEEDERLAGRVRRGTADARASARAPAHARLGARAADPPGQAARLNAPRR